MTNLEQVMRQELNYVLEMGKDEFCRAARDRVSCEKWVQRALYDRLKAVGTVEVLWEVEHVDLTLCSILSDDKLLLELKTFPTNYGQAGKPITQFIDSVIFDLNKLRARLAEGVVVGRVIWIAYPVPTDIPDQWIAHVARVKKASNATEKVASIPVGTDMKALVYLSQP